MPVLSVTRRESQLDDLFDRIGEIADISLQAEFCRYLCVRVSGYIEQSIEDILFEHARHRSGPTVVRYVGRTVDRTNLKAERLLETVGRFDGDLRKELERYMAGERKAALDSIMDHRNHVAHGEMTSISYYNLRRYYDNVKAIVKYVDELFLS